MTSLLPASADAANGGLADTVQRVKPSIVSVGTFQRTRTPPIVMRGTGFSVGDGRLVLTNAHVLPEATNERQLETLAVFLPDGDSATVRPSTVVAVDREHDTALLRMGGAPIPALRLRESTVAREGEDYAFTGFPIGMVLGLRAVTHRATISAITPIAIPLPNAGRLDANLIRRLANRYDVYQLDGTAYPGSSGSPLYDIPSGEVIGIINSVFVKETKETILQRPSGITYALPIKYGAALLRQSR